MGARRRLVDLVQQMGITEAELVRRVGENRQWVRRRVLGNTPIDIDDLPRFAQALNTPCTYFFEGTDCPEYQPAGRAASRPRKVADAVVPSATPYADIVLAELAPDLPDDIRELVRAAIRVTLRYRDYPSRQEDAS